MYERRKYLINPNQKPPQFQGLNVNALLATGISLMNSSPQEAITFFDRVLAIYPNHMEALANKGLALGNLGRYQEAIEYFDQAIAIIPDATETLNNKANALIELQQNIEPAV